MSDAPKIPVLYVDDNEQNLISFKANFRKDYKVYIATSSDEGMAILNKYAIPVVIADYRMPKVTGVEFFEQVLEKYPLTVRILLTGQADIKGVIDAINRGEVYRFITKPWNEEELRVSIQNAYEIYHTRNLLQEKNQELEKSYQELERFVYSASHDLTAPLMSILGIINVARMEKTNYENYMDLIEKSVKKLDVFIHNIIDYHRNTRLNYQQVEIDVHRLIAQTLENFEYYDNFNKVKVSLDVNQSAPFIADEDRLKIILNNIISNGIKYQRKSSEQSFLNIKFDIEPKWTKIEIQDNGIGIMQERLDNVFNMFYRASEQSSGAGIGLYIVREAVKKMGGEVKVSSIYGGGTTFKFTLPNNVAKEISAQGTGS